MRTTLQRIIAQGADAAEARALALMLLEEVAGLTTADVLMGRADSLDDSLRQRLIAMAQRIGEGEPIQYVLGYADFCGLRIGVAPGVLIPRPETEELVQWVCSDLNALATPRLLDIGTGSGCIALALKHLNPFSTVCAWDVSDDALRQARANAAALSLEIHTRKADIFDLPDTTERYDAIVSNPPYILRSEAADMEERVTCHEPHLALFVPDDDPLCCYRAIGAWAQQHLKPGASLYFEINRAQADTTVALLRHQGYTRVDLRTDQFGNPRMIRAQL